MMRADTEFHPTKLAPPFSGHFSISFRARAKGKTLAWIFDHASVPHAQAIREFIERHPEVKLFPFAPYSPEFNPIEQVWRGLKPLVHAAKRLTAELLNG